MHMLTTLPTVPRPAPATAAPVAASFPRMVTITQYAPRFATTQRSKTRSNEASPSSPIFRSPSMMVPSRELPMPNVTRIVSLNQAHATLLHCWTKLSRFIQDVQDDPASTASSNPQATHDQRREFQQWLNQWEVAFTAFLSSAVASMANDDITHSRILKTNHLACTVLVSERNQRRDYDAFEPEFHAMVELAGAVLRSRSVSSGSPRSNASTSSDSASGLRGLDVREPLMVLLSRCTQEAIRNRAAELLARCPPLDAA